VAPVALAADKPRARRATKRSGKQVRAH